MYQNIDYYQMHLLVQEEGCIYWCKEGGALFAAGRAMHLLVLGGDAHIGAGREMHFLVQEG